ncbi:MAG: TRAM domain-containing protein [Chthoniobacterales bacterium]
MPKQSVVSEPVELQIGDIAFGGAGVGRIDGKACFVKFTIPGENIRARIVRDHRKYSEAELLEIITPSEDRAIPPCEYAGICGGCSYQHINYPRQLEIKSAQVEQALRRVGGFEAVPMRPIIGSPKPLGYRNRITVHRADGMTGFYDFRGRLLVDIKSCAIASPAVNDMLLRLRKTRVHDGNFTLSEPLATGGFLQTNASVAALLLECVEGYCPTKGDLIVDAYCGAGFFLKKLLSRFSRGIGIEWSAASIRTANKKIAANESYLEGNVSAHLESALSGSNSKETVLILDPPSIGLDPKIPPIIQSMKPSRVIYVSCNPATLARDLKILSSHYQLEAVTPVDMFPQTAEIEVVVNLALK